MENNSGWTTLTFQPLRIVATTKGNDDDHLQNNYMNEAG